MSPDIYSFSDIAVGFVYFLIILSIGFFIQNRNKNNPDYTWFIPNLIFKMIFSLFFGFTFVEILGYGGDTVAYYESVNKLVNLLFENPVGYWREMISTPSMETLSTNFTTKTGYPPGWIYKEPESFYVAKILSIFSVFTFKSFIALSLIASFIFALASFRFFQIAKKYNIASDRMVAIATMFIPTVCFWCSGATKDMLILSSFYFALYQLFAYFDKERKFGVSNLILLFLMVYILTQIRPFMIYAILPPLLLSFGLGNINRMENKLFAGLLKSTLFIIGLIGAFLILSTEQGLEALGGQEYFEEMAIIQQDFAKNETYGGPRYDLGITDFTPLGMVSAAPSAVLTAIYRPFLWEAQGALLFVSGIESVVLILLTLRFLFFNGGIVTNFNRVVSNEFLLLALTFAFFFSFFVGFTSVLFNVLVRFKAPILGFIVLVLVSKKSSQEKNKETVELQE